MSQSQPPEAPRHPQQQQTHGHIRQDDYAWLRAANWRQAMLEPEVLPTAIREYLEAENTFAASVMAPTQALQETLFAELRGRIREDDSTVPARDGAYAYYVRYREGGQHPVICRHGERGGAEEILLDGDAEAADAAYFRIGATAHSPDHRYLAYAVDTRGAEAYSIRVRDLELGQDEPQPISVEATGDFEWAADSRTLLFTVLDSEHRPRALRRYTLGAPADALVYHEPDPGFFVGLEKTESARYLLVSSHDHTTSEVRYLPADRPDIEPTVFAPRREAVQYSITDGETGWLVLTNDGAEDFRICQAPFGDTAPSSWWDFIPHRPGRLIEGMLLFAEWLVRQELSDALPRLVVRRLADGVEHEIAQGEACYSLAMMPGFEYATDTLRFAYSSFTTPTRVYDYTMPSRERHLRKAQEVPSGHDPDAYRSHRLMARAPDGEAVPVSLFHRADLVPDAQTPLLLYGYGAYGLRDLPSFSSNRLSLVDRGFVYAVAHVRGGVERGYRWYRGGRGVDKPNTFRDYITVAEALIEAGYTGEGRITAHGGSAGGMLVGAVLNQRPELFHAAVADVPFVDVLTTMLDASLPLTPPEWPEWGNPIEDEQAYRTIGAYSPYDNVQAQAYPHILVTAGVSDPRVTYWEPAKWVARLRRLKTDDHLLLLKTNMSAGHGGPGGRFQFLEEVAYRYAFLLFVYGLA